MDPRGPGICRDCPTGRESRSVPTLFVSRGTGTGTEVCETSGTGTKNRETVLSRPMPILTQEPRSAFTRSDFGQNAKSFKTLRGNRLGGRGRC